jgi:phospholipid transport system substrate-binding protein
VGRYATIYLRCWVWNTCLYILLWCLAGSSIAAKSDGPTQLVQHLIKTISSIKETNNGNLSEADRAHNEAATKAANAILDIPGVSQWTLGKYWEARSPAEQQEFIALLEQLFGKIAYAKSAQFFGDLNITVTGEKISGQRAVVKTTVRHPKEGLVSIDYQLVQNNETWRVRDILLDDVSMATNLRSQFNKIITEHSYAELLRRLREKLAE